tara:strand:- start:72 stop:260 length:189 start_codon:yes stop_codon:yes gene_type:complete
MPKKKLTRKQVALKFKFASNKIYDLMLDKFGHADSFVSMSKPKIMEMLDTLQKAQKRVQSRR